MNYKGGLPKCCDCGKIISDYRAKRCKRCFHKFAVGVNGIGYKHGKATTPPKCLDCGKQLKSFTATRCMSCSHLGLRNHSWNGGSSFHDYPSNFTKVLKDKIRVRDGYKCQICGCSQQENIYDLDIHHIDYDKNNNDLENLVALCHVCHPKTNYNRNKWVEHFTSVKIC